MRIGSLFTGYGGLDVAAEQFFNAKTAWYSEIEPAAVKILGEHYPGIPNLGDVTAIDWAAVSPVDVLTAGYPCQPFSQAGKRKGAKDERHLWPIVRTAIDALRPRYVVLENVRGHLTLGFGDVLSDLSGVGYSARWGVVRASDVGACHQRARVFIVAYPNGSRWDENVQQPENISAENGKGTSGIANRHRANKIATDANGERCGGREDHRVVGRLGEETSEDGAGQGASNKPREQPRAGNGSSATDTSGTERGSTESEYLGTAIGPTAELGEHTSEVTDWGKYEPAIRKWESISRPAPAPTVAGLSGRPRLSPFFVEWMMGLPEGWVTGRGLSIAKELKLLGNGVVPQQALLALRLLLGAE